MLAQQLNKNLSSELNDLTLAFVVRTQNHWSPEALERFQSYLRKNDYIRHEADLQDSLAQAQEIFMEDASRLFICTGKSCSKRRKFDISEEGLEKLAHEHNCSILTTKCQGPCNQSPVATLRVGENCQMFSQFETDNDLSAVLKYVKRAANSSNALIQALDAEPFLFNPKQDRRKPSVALKKFEFLVGLFRGEGSYLAGPGTFWKETTGSWEADGRFISLRAGTTYLIEGKQETYNSFVMIGSNADGKIEAWSFGSGGNAESHQLIKENGRICFIDKMERKPGERRLQKVLVPGEQGYEELLEIDPGSGIYEVYSTVKMERA